jgi:hypothetical protein
LSSVTLTLETPSPEKEVRRIGWRQRIYPEDQLIMRAKKYEKV